MFLLSIKVRASELNAILFEILTGTEWKIAQIPSHIVAANHENDTCFGADL